MTRDEAVAMIQALFRAIGEESQGLNEANLGGIENPDQERSYFEYEPDRGTLKVTSNVYTFEKEPQPGILEAFQEEERLGTVDSGGGSVDYEPENQGLYLARRYTEPVDAAQFAADIDRLGAAARQWSQVVPERVANRVFRSSRS
jgi:hypothetical protein